MFRKSQSIVHDLSMLDSQRRCTDILCIIVGLGLTITLAVFAIAVWNRRNLYLIV